MKKKRPLRSKELAEAWKAGVMPLHVAARRHFKLIGIWPVHEKVMLALELLIGFANLGRWDTLLPVDDDRELTVAQAIDEFQLSAFLG
jgi:hypothetical protein